MRLEEIYSLTLTHMATKAVTTTNHDEIRGWIESHGGDPAIVEATKNGASGVLRVDFHSTQSQGSLKDVSWDEFFDIFEKNHLAFIYQEPKSGKDSRFFKFIERQEEDEDTTNTQANAKDARRMTAEDIEDEDMKDQEDITAGAGSEIGLGKNEKEDEDM